MILNAKIFLLSFVVIAPLGFCVGCAGNYSELRKMAWYQEQVKWYQAECEAERPEGLSERLLERRIGGALGGQAIWVGIVKQVGQENFFGREIVLEPAQRILGSGKAYVSGEPFRGLIEIHMSKDAAFPEGLPVTNEVWAVSATCGSKTMWTAVSMKRVGSKD